MERNSTHTSRVANFGAFEQSMVSRIEDATRSTLFNSDSIGQFISSDHLQFGSFSKPTDVFPPVHATGSLPLQQHKGQKANVGSLIGGFIDSWGESSMADASPRTDTSTDIDIEEKNQMLEQVQAVVPVTSDSSDQSKGKTGAPKNLRRLAQNREAARKSRLRKKELFFFYLNTSPKVPRQYSAQHLT